MVAESFVGKLRLFVVGIAIVAFDEPQMQFEVMELDVRPEEVKKLIRLVDSDPRTRCGVSRWIRVRRPTRTVDRLRVQ